ncbi:molecular chaperone DnaJ [Streptomyces cocklensis]|uniref:Protein kinase domain-containing protein n=1 Tax=Actinacidiphila cocklensis TaxID=887465 RepID=A0A9W4GPQ0_9ACTN|nr:molecular chaperone DnaJ [Actinacidiphila cocklensis]MDD1063837.1 molecular chaperone DnaJ [Actinacidiphila cocklensis]CAG6392608.1 Protein kinase domain-containing protein [Actinacidiphila cocklensis]
MTASGARAAAPAAAADAQGAGAADFDDALAALTGGFPAEPREAARHYRRLARLLHPDTAPAGRAEQAAAAFARLTAAWQARHETVTGGRHRYVLGPVLAEGGLATVRGARYDSDGDRHAAVLKIPREPRDNDLMEHEADVLTRLRTVGEPRHRAYAPTLIESFRQRHPDGTEQVVNAFVPLTGFHTLAEVAAAHPGGLDPRDAAWMWRRLLTALGWAHRARLVHGAVFPEHVLIHPELHGLVLVDWCYATATGTDVPVLLHRHAGSYPPEALAHLPATPATDIHLASLCIAQLTGDLAPPQMRAFLRGCTLPEQERRPQDAWQLLAELDDLLERLYGPRTFRPFTMPAAPPA